MSFFDELKRRNVFKVATAYIAVGWLIMQVGEVMAPALQLPQWLVSALAYFLILGFPVAIILSWAFELTPEGIRRDEGASRSTLKPTLSSRSLDYWIIGMLFVAVAFFAFDKFVLTPKREAEQRAALEQQKSSEIAKAREHVLEDVRSKSVEASFKPNSIAVLPFVNMSSDPEQEYFSDGISEELLNLLANVPQLHVTARTSSFSFKGKKIEIPEIARQLHVSNILEGSVRKAGGRVRITAQLIHAADGFQLWSQTYDRSLDDIFAVQDEIAGEVVKELKVRLLDAVPKTRATDPQAYILYLQARELGKRGTAEAFAKSDSLLQKALDIDEGYAPAWNELARNALNEISISMRSSLQGIASARQAIDKAIMEDPNYAPSYARLGRLAELADNDLLAAARDYEHALTLGPSAPDVLAIVAAFLQNIGRANEALEVYEYLARRDPVNEIALYDLGVAEMLVKHFEAAASAFRTVQDLRPGLSYTESSLGLALLFQGDAAAALTHFVRIQNDVIRQIDLAMAYHALGRKAESDAALATLIAKYEKDAAYNIASVYAYRGEADNAFEWLDKAVEYQDPGLAFIIASIQFDNIRSDPRWLPFLERIGRSPEQLAAIDFTVTLPE